MKAKAIKLCPLQVLQRLVHLVQAHVEGRLGRRLRERNFEWSFLRVPLTGTTLCFRVFMRGLRVWGLLGLKA